MDYDKHFSSYIKRSECNRLLKAQRPCKITKHPEYKKMQKKLKEKYAIKDTSTCPPTYKECNIESHPRFISQAKTIDKLKKQLKNISNHPEYQAMQRVLRSLKRKNENLRDTTVSSANAKSIMEKYACKDTSTCPPTYKKCDKVRSGCKKIESHPKYIKLQKKLAKAKTLANANANSHSSEENSTALASVKDHPMFLEMKRGYKREIGKLEQQIALLKEFEIKFKSHKCKKCPVLEQTSALAPGISEERYDELYRKYANQGEEITRLRSKHAEVQSSTAEIHDRDNDRSRDKVWFADNQQEETKVPVPYPYPGFWN